MGRLMDVYKTIKNCLPVSLYKQIVKGAIKDE